MPKFLEYLKNIFKGNNTKKLESSFVNFKDEELQKYFMKKFKKENFTKQDLASLRNVTYSGIGEKVFQEDIDNIIRYCDLSNGQLYLYNLDLSDISLENLRVRDLMIKRTRVGGTKYPSKDILKSLGVENSVGINFDDFDEYKFENLYISQMNIMDLEIAKKFKESLERLSIFDNPLDNLIGIEDFTALKELSVAYTNIGIDCKDIIMKLRDKEIRVELLGTPLEEEINRLYKIKKEEEERKRLDEEGKIELDENFVKYLNNYGLFGDVEETRKITIKDIERLNTRSKLEDIDLIIPSEYSEEFLKINSKLNVDVRRLTINIGKGDNNFNIEEFSENKGTSSLLELQIDTPCSIDTQPQEYLSSRYGITYDFDNERYHYDDIKRFQDGLNEFAADFKEVDKSPDMIKDLYRRIREKITMKEQEIIDSQEIRTFLGGRVRIF